MAITYMDYIGIKADGHQVLDLRNPQIWAEVVANGVTPEDVESNTVSVYAESLAITDYITAAGFDEGKRWNGAAWVPFSTRLVAVFPSAADSLNSLPPIAISLDAHPSNKRHILTPLNDGYTYTGSGKHSGSEGANIPAVDLTAAEVLVLLDSPKFNADFEVMGAFDRSDISFGQRMTRFIIAQLTRQIGATDTEKRDALVLLKSVYENLKDGLIAAAAYNLATLVPAGIYSEPMQAEALAEIGAYLAKFPR